MSNLARTTHLRVCDVVLKVLLSLSTGVLFLLPSEAIQIAVAQEQFDFIEHTTSTPTLDVWMIRSPNVQQESTPYEQIAFKEGDRIIIRAAGCVQTGGAGKTWKRYVDPQGPNSDHLYHGLVKVPGTTDGFVRLGKVINKPLQVPDKIDIGEALHLWLGYEDDGFGDNGYWGHDDGTGDQCRGVGAAWVRILIEHAAPALTHVILVSTRDGRLAINAWDGAKHGTILRLNAGCRRNNPDCTWTYRNGMLLSDKDPTLAINAWGGAKHGTVLRLHAGCKPDNPDCTWSYSNGMFLSNRDSSLAINAWGGAQQGTVLRLHSGCRQTNPDCTWSW